MNGPTITPPIKDFNIPQGDYKDSTKTWDPPVIPEMDKKLKKLRAASRKAEMDKQKEDK